MPTFPTTIPPIYPQDKVAIVGFYPLSHLLTTLCRLAPFIDSISSHRAVKRAKPGSSHMACSKQTIESGETLMGPRFNAGDCAAAVSENLPHTAAAAASYYDLFLSYSANFASGYQPNPPGKPVSSCNGRRNMLCGEIDFPFFSDTSLTGSGYHWTLLPSRMKLSSTFAAKLAARSAK